MPSTKRKFGDLGEKLAEDYLKNKGYYVVEKNYWKPWGEIDLIGKKDEMVVFFEVKTRDLKHTHDFLPEQSVNASKIRKLRNICETYLNDRRYSINQEWQIDVLSISVNKYSGQHKIDHFENAVFDR